MQRDVRSAGAIGLLDRFSATTERLAQALHFFSLNEGQPSGWPARASRTVGRGSHPKGRRPARMASIRRFLGVGRPVAPPESEPAQTPGGSLGSHNPNYEIQGSDPIIIVMGSDDSGLVGGRRVPNLEVYDFAARPGSMEVNGR